MVTLSVARPSHQEMRRTVLLKHCAALAIAGQRCKLRYQHDRGGEGETKRAHDIDAPSAIQAHSSPPVATPGSSGIPHVS